MNETIKNLEKIFGSENVSASDVDKLMYSFDASQRQGKTHVVVWPKNASQIQELIKYALDAKLDIVPRGGGTGLVGGCVPDNSVVVDVSKMN
ncbi:MAG: FAD-binding oxidoreductase, partial [Candidatus Aenigmarchaeota archaeon]|nr:FAD-binding oxidoreductase [Candidatus Aenigmarchaeota archaeon]